MIDLSEENIKKAFDCKGYKFFTAPYSINVFGIRMQTNTNLFDDYICVAYYNNDGCFQVVSFEATTDPGSHWLKNPMRKTGCAIMVEGQYRGAFKIGPHGRKRYKAGRQFKAIPVYRDNNKDTNHDLDPSTIEEGIFYTNIHHAWSAKYIGKNSAGCQVIKSKPRFEKEFIPLLEKSTGLYGSTFTYTLFNKSDFE